MEHIQFVDTTLRDGNMSLWATNMTTAMLLPTTEHIDRAGFLAAEIFSAASFKKCIRELRDDPFDRLRLATQRMPHTRMRCIRSRHMTAFDVTPLSIAQLWLEQLAVSGIQEIRGSDPSNTVSSWESQVRMARSAGIDSIVNVIYTISPKHTDEYYAEKVRAAASLQPFRLCLKDPGGLLTPERTRALVPVFLHNCGGLPVELHTHCNTGLGPLCVVEAIKAGIRIINTAIPPLANASSLPSVYNTVENAVTLGYAPDIDAEALRPVTEHLSAVARRYGLPVGQALEYDEFHYRHQVPGGMISNLRHQLVQMGAQGRLREVLEEAIQVRADLGYPIMVTPYSQFVGAQSAINVLTGERYREVSDQIIQYALGLWGEEERAAMDPNVRDRILARPRAKELARRETPNPTLADLRRVLGGPGVSDEELVLRYYTSADDVATMRQLGAKDLTPVAGADATWPLAELVGKLTERSGVRQFFMQRGDFVLHLARSDGPNVR